jgi:hypothetical protein
MEINQLAVDKTSIIEKYLKDPIFTTIIDSIKAKKTGAQEQIIDFLEQIYVWVININKDINSILTSFEILKAATSQFRVVSKEYNNIVDKITNIFSYIEQVSKLNDAIYDQDKERSVSDESSNIDSKIQEVLEQLGHFEKLKNIQINVNELNNKFDTLKEGNYLASSSVSIFSDSADTSQNNNSNTTNSFLFFCLLIFILLFCVLMFFLFFKIWQT